MTANTSITYDVPGFGFLPFDSYVMAEWNPNSKLSKDEQKRALVEEWIRMGRYGRNQYYDLFHEEPPDVVPRDLLSDQDRAVDGQISRTFWIRTWFGHKDDKASQEAADTAYKRLFKTAWQEDDDEYDWLNGLDREFIFDNKEEFFDDYPASEIVDGVVAPKIAGTVPSYVIKALMHYPDQLNCGSFDSREQTIAGDSEEEIADWEKRQDILVLVADRTACEKGWVLFLAINHKGQVLPFRLRERAAYYTGCEAREWGEGVALQEYANDSDEEEEYWRGEGDGFVER